MKEAHNVNEECRIFVAFVVDNEIFGSRESFNQLQRSPIDVQCDAKFAYLFHFFHR